MQENNDSLKVLLVSYMEPNAPSGIPVCYRLLQDNLPAHGAHVDLVTPNNCSRFIRYVTGGIWRLLIRTRLMRGSHSILLSNILHWVRIHSALKRIG